MTDAAKIGLAVVYWGRGLQQRHQILSRSTDTSLGRRCDGRRLDKGCWERRRCWAGSGRLCRAGPRRWPAGPPAGRSVGPWRSLDQLRPLALLVDAGAVAVGDHSCCCCCCCCRTPVDGRQWLQYSSTDRPTFAEFITRIASIASN